MDTEKGILPGSGTTQPAGYLPGPGGPQFYYEEPPQVDLRDYLRIFLKRRRIILLVFAGVVSSALAYTITAPRIYQATAKVQVLQPQQSGMLVVPIADQQKPEDSLKTQAKIVQSSIVAEQTAQRLQTDHHVNISPQEIMGSVKVAIEDPDVLAISAVSRDPARAAKIANAVQDTYIGHNTSLARAEASNARAFLEQQLPRVESELKRSEDAVSDYKRRNNIHDSDEIALMKARMAFEYTNEAEQASAEQQASEAELQSLRLRLAQERPTRMDKRVVNDPVAEGYRQEVASTEVELAKARAQYEENHPRVQALKDKLDEMQEQMRKRFGNKRSSFVLEDVEEPNPEYQALQARISDEESKLQRLQAQTNAFAGLAEKCTRNLPSAPDAHVELARLVHTKETSEKTYLSMLEQLQEARLNEARKLGAARVVDIARQINVPISPRPAQTLALAMIVGLMAGVGLAMLQEYMDTSVHDPDELMERTGISALGFIPATHEGGVPAKIAARAPKSPISEGFRTIRSNLKFSHLDSPLRTMMVTSAGAGEGKSFTIANLAIVFAQSGVKTILVDADLRRPSLHRVFGLEHTPGLTNVLAGELPLEKALRPTEIPNLTILPSGSIPPNPSELLDSKRMGQLLDQLQDRYEVVLVDTPPALVVTDAVVLSAKVDATILVVEQGRPSYRALLEFRRLVEQARGKLVGAVINKVKSEGGDYYYYYYYRYYSYYGEGDSKKLGRKRPPRALPDPGREPESPSEMDKV